MHLDKVLLKLEQQMRHLDKDIHELLKAYGDNAEANAQELKQIKKNIHVIFN